MKIQKSPGTYASGYQSSLKQILVWSIKKSKIWSALATHTRIILTSMKPKHKKILPAKYLVSDEHFDDVLVGGVGFQLVEPVLDLGERLPACDVVDDDDALVSML